MNSDSDAESAAQTKKMLQELIEKNEAMNCPTCHVSFQVLNVNEKEIKFF